MGEVNAKNGDTWAQRLQTWYEESERKLRKRWYMWPVLFVVELLWHRIYQKTNAFLDSHGPGMMAATWKHVPSDPITLAILVAICTVLVLIVHAYFESRRRVTIQLAPTPNNRAALSSETPKASHVAEADLGVFKVQSMRADPPSRDEDIHFKNKLRMNLTNITGKDIYVWVPLWESSLVQAQDDPPGSRMLLERRKGGWHVDLGKGEWVTHEDKKSGKRQRTEYCQLKLQPDFTFNCYVGLAPPSTENIEGILKRYDAIGTVLFPVKIDGILHEVRVPAREV